jgi:hypothetical protein
MVSEKWTFKGWDWKKFVTGRKRLLVTLVGAITTYVATQNPALSGIVGAASELAFAVFEYAAKE